jgi:putative Mn2+ efflux pump MntP
MSFFSLVLIAFGLSVDAFAASVGRGAVVERPHFGLALRTGLVFGFVEALTPIAGWCLGAAFSTLVESVDHWIAFALLLAVGGRTLAAGLSRAEDAPKAPSGLIGLIATAIGTSLDAMAVGVSLALLEVDIVQAALVIGATTTVMTTFGMCCGKLIGERIGRGAEVGAGVTLILIGCGILAQHLVVG